MTTEEKQGVSAWLRGIVDECGVGGTRSCLDIAEVIGIDCKHEKTCRDCIAKMMTAIADRIDAERALPEDVEWPRFEDGEPVRFGDEVDWDGDVMRVGSVWLHREGWGLHVSSTGVEGTFHGEYGERAKRPKPKVLGADGAPIEVGDVVYYDGEPHPLTVVGITRDGKDALVDANGEESCVEGGRPQDFSHDAPKPVLDADGVPIKVGDTVYFVNGNGRALIVERIDANGSDPAVDLVYEGERIYWHSANPEKLTHEPPDSWEKLEEDARKTACNYALAPRDEDGLTTCDGCRFQKSESCSNEMTIDLVKRAKKLAGVEEEVRND